MITKELLSEVLDKKLYLEHLWGLNENNELLYYEGENGDGKYINIHELAHKCKEWAMSIDNIFDKEFFKGEDCQALEGRLSSFSVNKRCVDLLKFHAMNNISEYEVCIVIVGYHGRILNTRSFFGNTEIETVAKACEWIRANK